MRMLLELLELFFIVIFGAIALAAIGMLALFVIDLKNRLWP